MALGSRMNVERRRIWRAIAAAVIVVLVLGVVVYVSNSASHGESSSSLASDTSATSSAASTPAAPGSNLLTNGGFETGDLQGWQTSGYAPPTVDRTGLENLTYAANFQTPANGQDLAQCTTLNLQCGVLNVSTISQKIPIDNFSRSTHFSFALDPAFSYPAGLQITLSFALASDPDALNATIFYLFYTSMQQCESYTQILAIYNTFHTTIYCLTIPQGEWTTMTRNIAHDLVANIAPSYLDGSTLTLSMSFAGGNSTDKLSVGSVFFG